MLKKIMLTVLTLGVLVAVSSTPAEAAVTIDGNGAHSWNRVRLLKKLKDIRHQTNVADFDNDVDVENETGENEAKHNTGGDVEVNAEVAEADVEIENMANSNLDESEGCGCPTEDVDVEITDNGAWSSNKVVMKTKVVNVRHQTNVADFDNDVDVENETGENTANGNTGGDVLVMSGDATATVKITNNANSNVME
ncbi:hypothetical protein HY469_04400 [Candidatus Roizmanbacteria bacterium]|nr:hypothetical protein [Candidatus Roizmanbacteria bacterium]